MMADSSAAGYLAPAAAPAPLYDSALDKFLHDVFAGISGLAGTEVRPRWQGEPANIDQFGSDWLAFGVQEYHPDKFAYISHDPVGPAGAGADNMQRHETLDILLSAYGPNSMGNMARIRDGLQVEQNRAVLMLAGMGLVETGDPFEAPTLIKERWQRRIDMSVIIKRQIQRQYPILNLNSAQGVLIIDVGLDDEHGVTPIVVNGPIT